MELKLFLRGYAKIEKTLDNQQLEQMVETSNEWIVSRTGILKDIFQINQVPSQLLKLLKSNSKSRFKSTCF